MILTDLSNIIKKLWEKISFHKHFKSNFIYEQSRLTTFVYIIIVDLFKFVEDMME